MPMQTPDINDLGFKELQKKHGAIVQKSFARILIVLLVTVAAWPILASVPSDYVCRLSDSWFVSLWPFNTMYSDQLSFSEFSLHQKCWFFAFSAFSSFAWMCFLVVTVTQEIFRSDATYVKDATEKMASLGRTVSIWCFSASVLTFLILFIGFVDRPSLYNLSLKQPIGSAAFKVGFMLIPFFFSTLTWALAFFTLSTRYFYLAAKATK